jgi:nucleoside-diphosphate-sugar epimerase
MKICITGGAGMIGSALLRKLATQGHEIIVIDNLWRGNVDNINSISGWDFSSNFYNIDLSDGKNEETLLKIIDGTDVMIHLADIVAGIGYVFNNQYEIFKINNTINTNVFSISSKLKIKKILYAGTACSFPKDLQLSLDSVLHESQLFPAEPESAYGWSKLIGTMEMQYMAEKYDIDVTTLMLHNVYGPFCDIDTQRSQVIPSIIRKIVELNPGEDLEVWGSGNQGRAFLHVDDVANAFALAITKNNLPKIIQVGPRYCTSIKELVTVLANDVSKKNINIVYDTTKPEGDLGRCADFSIAQKYLDWQPQVTLLDGLTSTYNWIKDKIQK